MDFAARRITAAKPTNAGQICLSVNHVFVEPEIVEQFLQWVTYHFGNLLRGEGKDHLFQIVNDRTFDRLCSVLDKSSGKIICGGEKDPKSRFFEPTVVRDLTMQDSLMSEELFGPILPVISATLEEAISMTNDLPTPLAIYLFVRDRNVLEKTLDQTLSGGVTVNNVFFHTAIGDALFGGVGESGYGAYYGPHDVDCFSHKRAIVESPKWMEKLMGFTYASFDTKNLKTLAVDNSLGFRRGQTMGNQKFGGGSTAWLLVLVAAILISAASWRK